jgi:hypothetical protein
MPQGYESMPEFLRDISAQSPILDALMAAMGKFPHAVAAPSFPESVD